MRRGGRNAASGRRRVRPAPPAAEHSAHDLNRSLWSHNELLCKTTCICYFDFAAVFIFKKNIFYHSSEMGASLC